MSFIIIYSKDYDRVIPAVIIDAREGTPIANQIGIVIKAYIDEVLNSITSNSIFYTLSTSDAVLAGYFILTVDKENSTVVLNSILLRPAFQKNITEVTLQINNFIAGNTWKNDYL